MKWAIWTLLGVVLSVTVSSAESMTVVRDHERVEVVIEWDREQGVLCQQYTVMYLPLASSAIAQICQMTRVSGGFWYDLGKKRCGTSINFFDVRSYKSEIVVTIRHPQNGIVGVAILERLP